jgi:hypothetical protein
VPSHREPEGTTKRIEVAVTKKVTVHVDGKPALELACIDGRVKVTALPRNSSNRPPVALDDLAEAVHALRQP